MKNYKSQLTFYNFILFMGRSKGVKKEEDISLTFGSKVSMLLF